MSRNDLSRILEMLVKNRLDEAEKNMESIQPKNEYESGYLKGLRGILYSIRKPVNGGLLQSSKEDLERHLRSIRETIQTHYLTQEEEGFFSAWIDFIRKISRGK
ncbi:MAG: hypothetical protein ACUVQ0_01800 [Thermoproteota archaeon]